uniref:Uncharacterized protein n=1 Tax=Parascaris univalens TaxID=6257 RepID=A0A915AVP0_PARUN
MLYPPVVTHPRTIKVLHIACFVFWISKCGVCRDYTNCSVTVDDWTSLRIQVVEHFN